MCSGSGHVIVKPCQKCTGRGKQSVKSSLKVKVPAGIDHGQRLKLRGEGEAGSAGGASGDLFVQIFVKDHPIFLRDEYDLLCEIPVNYPAIVLGAEIEVPTLEGKATMKVPAGTPSGKVFRLRQKGVPVLGSTKRGDLKVRVRVHVPTAISDEHRKHLEALRKLDGDVPKEEQKGFLDKMREMFS